MNSHVVMLMRPHCKTKPKIKLREMEPKRARIKRITPRKREQGNAYVTKFMSLMNAHTLSHPQKGLIEQKIKRYAIKSNKNFRKNPGF
jgi:hypothetical protein